MRVCMARSWLASHVVLLMFYYVDPAVLELTLGLTGG